MKEHLRSKILEILQACPDLAIATLREDGFPQNTTVSFVHDGMTMYCGVGAGSQKAINMRRDPRISITMTAPYETWDAITGLSIAARAEEVTSPDTMNKIGLLMLNRFPQIANMDPPAEMGDACFFQFTPFIISVLDYSKGFGHADLVTVEADDLTETLASHRHDWLIPRGT